jgi:predicted regulator of Ras-like GTPase activity (Roadblock/LC7/MglB family)
MTGFNLPATLADQIERILFDLRRRTKAECIMLADISGQLINTQGDLEGSDPTLVSALAAGDVAALLELARQIGEPEPRGPFLHEGKRRSFYMMNVGGSFVLIIIFNAETPLGLVRLFAGRIVQQLDALTGEFESYMDETQNQALPDDFSAGLADELEKTFDGF